MSHAAASPRDDTTVTPPTLDFVRLHSSSVALLDRALRHRRASTGFGALLREEVIAYELVWPN